MHAKKNKFYMQNFFLGLWFFSTKLDFRLKKNKQVLKTILKLLMWKLYVEQFFDKYIFLYLVQCTDFYAKTRKNSLKLDDTILAKCMKYV